MGWLNKETTVTLEPIKRISSNSVDLFPENKEQSTICPAG